jgi:hypothetical protein
MSVVVAASQNTDFLLEHLVYEAMLSVNPARPTAAELSFQQFCLPNASEGVALNLTNELNDAESLGPVALNPPS